MWCRNVQFIRCGYCIDQGMYGMHLYLLQVVGMKGTEWKLRCFIFLYELASMYGNACILLIFGLFVGHSIYLSPAISIEGKENT